MNTAKETADSIIKDIASLIADTDRSDVYVMETSLVLLDKIDHLLEERQNSVVSAAKRPLEDLTTELFRRSIKISKDWEISIAERKKQKKEILRKELQDCGKRASALYKLIEETME